MLDCRNPYTCMQTCMEVHEEIVTQIRKFWGTKLKKCEGGILRMRKVKKNDAKYRLKISWGKWVKNRIFKVASVIIIISCKDEKPLQI